MCTEHGMSDEAALELAERIGMPGEVISALNEARTAWRAMDNQGRLEELMDGMTQPAIAKASWKELKELCAPDPDGWKILYGMLQTAATRTEPLYRRAGMGEDVFLATMGAFTRFVGESIPRWGKLAFDRDFWMWRHLSLLLFRTGTLEFECATAGAGVPRELPFERAVAVHIPSDARMTEEELDASFAAWDAFAAAHLPAWTGLPMTCESWLLSPELEKLLPGTSRILAFQHRFEIKGFRPDTYDWREWIFNASRLPVEELPENTSLQRAAKAFALEGGNIGTGVGVLRR